MPIILPMSISMMHLRLSPVRQREEEAKDSFAETPPQMMTGSPKP